MMKRFKEWIKKLLAPVGKWFRKLGSKLHGPWQRFRNFLKKVFDPISRRYQKLSNKKKKIIQGYLYIMPWIVGLVIFGVYQVANPSASAWPIPTNRFSIRILWKGGWSPKGLG